MGEGGGGAGSMVLGVSRGGFITGSTGVTRQLLLVIRVVELVHPDIRYILIQLFQKKSPRSH